jgi:phosphatidylglycerophosphatase A
MKDRISLFLGTAGCIGFIPGAPGTYASIATTLVLCLVQRRSQPLPPELYISALCLITIIGVIVSGEVSRIRGVEDPSIVVIDEVAGQMVTFLFIPLHMWNAIIGTILFRIFDIWKPFPVRQLESLKSGAGIMADDLMAGVYAGVILHVLNRVLHW